MNNDNLLVKIFECVEFGKVNKDASFPPDMKGMDGADELTRMARDGYRPSEILNDALIKAMERSSKFQIKNICTQCPSAKAMNASMSTSSLFPVG
jgi:5-methyltetrahydrofolate--homocysteine methyltransferase